VELGAYPDVRIGALPTDINFDSRLGTIVPLGTRVVSLTSPRETYDLAVQVNPLGQARICIPSGSPAMAGVLPC
jgi:hypothetical protein